MRVIAIGVLVVVATACSSGDPVSDGSELLPVVRVLDGDSIVVEDRSGEQEVRLLGINTPERNECFDDEARTAAIGLIGEVVSLDGTEQDRFGRTLAYVFNADAVLVNRELVAGGHALALSNDHRLRDEFKLAEDEAFTAGLGRWGPDACGPPSDGMLAITGLNADAPGNDAENPNGEWVEITNEGAAAVDVGGWVIRDESSQHRFVFPDAYMLAPGETVRILSGSGTGPDLYWAAGDPVWSNDGDTAYLLDRSGNVRDRRRF